MRINENEMNDENENKNLFHCSVVMTWEKFNELSFITCFYVYNFQKQLQKLYKKKEKIKGHLQNVPFSKKFVTVLVFFFFFVNRNVIEIKKNVAVTNFGWAFSNNNIV